MMQFSLRENLKSVGFNAFHLLGAQYVLRNFKLRQQQPTILCLHRVSSDYDHFWDPIKPEHFERLIKYLVKYYEVVSVEDAAKGLRGKRPKVVLSFDDGYYDFYSNVLPVLKYYSLPANHNIVTDVVNGKQELIWTEQLNFVFNYFRQNKIDDVLRAGDFECRISLRPAQLDHIYILFLKELFKMDQVTRQATLSAWLNRYGLTVRPHKMMGWNEIRECAENGVEFGSHTKTHPVLSTEKSDEVLTAELITSKAEIEKNLGRPVPILAPPNGLCNEHVLTFSAEAGYKYVLGIGEHSGIEKRPDGITFLSRLNLISEPYSNMILRIEELQGNIKKLLKR